MDILQQAYGVKSPMEIMTGKELQSTFWGDFTVADRFGASAILDTYKRAKAGYRDDKDFGTELALVLNWKLWEHYDKGNESLAKLYDRLWKELDGYIMENWKGEQLKHYIKETD